MLGDASISINKLAQGGESLHVHITPFSSCPTANSWLGVVSSTSLNTSDGIRDTDDTLRSQASGKNATIPSKEEIVGLFA